MTRDESLLKPLKPPKLLTFYSPLPAESGRLSQWTLTECIIKVVLNQIDDLPTVFRLHDAGCHSHTTSVLIRSQKEQKAPFFRARHELSGEIMLNFKRSCSS